PSPPTAPVSIDTHLQRMRQFLLDETGVAAEVETFKSGVLAELDILKTKVTAFSLTVAPPPPAADPIPAPQSSAMNANIVATVFGGPGDGEGNVAYPDVAPGWA